MIDAKDLDVVKAANGVNWVTRTMKVEELDADMRQEDLMCAILQESGQSKANFMLEHNMSEADWDYALNLNGFNDVYIVSYQESSLPALAHDIVRDFQDEIDSDLKDLYDSLNDTQKKLFDRINNNLIYAKSNVAFVIDDQIINGKYFSIFDEEGNWYLIDRLDV